MGRRGSGLILWLAGKRDTPLTPEQWARLAFTFVWVDADADLLPHRPQTTDGDAAPQIRMQIGPLTANRIPYSLADVVVSTLKTGAIPKITEAIRVVPTSRQALRQVTLPTGRVVDPNQEDPVFALAEERVRLEFDTGLDPTERERLRGLLKGMRNSAVGLTAQVLDDEPTSEPLYGKPTIRRIERPLRLRPGRAFSHPALREVVGRGGRRRILPWPGIRV